MGGGWLLGKNRMRKAGLVLALSLGLLICLTQVMPTSQAKTTSLATASGAPVDPSKTISFSTNIGPINLTSTINASLSCPSSIDAGSSGSGNLSVTAGTSSISFTFNYLVGTYTASLPSFTTPLGSMDVPIPFAEILGAGLKARFTAHISASVNSSPSGLVYPTSMTYMSSDSKSISISTSTLSSGSISVSSSYTYDSTIEIILSVPFLGEYTVLGPYNINSAVGSDILSTTITVNPPPGEGANPIVIILIIVVLVTVAVVAVAVKKHRKFGDLPQILREKG